MKKIWSYLSIPATALAVLTGSIAWVVLLRPFYYVQIAPWACAMPAASPPPRPGPPIAT